MSQPPSSEGMATSSPTLRELPFQVYLRRSDDGELVLVPDFSLEEYLRLYERATAPTRAQPPEYVIRNLSMSGEIRPPVAELELLIEIERIGEGRAEVDAVRSGERAREGERRDGNEAGGNEAGDQAAGESVEGKQDERWIAVPLRLGATALRDDPTLEGEGESFITYDMKSRGYLLWWAAPAGATLRITLPLRVAVATSNGERRLAVSLPPSTKMAWRTPLAESIATAKLQGDGVLEVRRRPNDGTELVGSGMHGEILISWKQPSMGGEYTGGVDVSGTIRVTVSGPQQITTEATLQIHPLRGDVNAVQVRLPPHMTLRLVPDSTFEFNVIERGDAGGDLVVVTPRSESGISGDWVVPLTCEAQTRATASAAVWEPAKFEVIGAARHRGTIECVVQGEWVVMAETGPRMTRLVDQPFGFRYYAQPPQLLLTIRRRLVRGRVESRHHVRVDRDRMQMDSVLGYTFVGARPSRLRVDCHQWQLVDVLLGGEPLADPARQGDDGIVEVDLPPDAPIGDELQLELILSKSLDAAVIRSERPLQFSVPRPVPLAEGTLFIAPATVEVERASDVEVTPLASELRGLMFDTPTSSDSVPGLLRLRERGGRDPSVFVAAFRAYDRRIEVDEEVVVSGAAGQWQCTQYLTFRIHYQPGFRLRFAVPPGVGVGDLDDIECVLLDNPTQRGPIDPAQPRLEWLAVETTAGEDLPEGWTGKEVVLPAPQLGVVALAIRFRPTDTPLTDKARRLSIPWWIAEDVDGTRVIRGEQRLTLEGSSQFSASIEDSSWVPVAVGDDARQWIAPNPVVAGQVSMKLTPVELTQVTDVYVHRRWIQTWLSRSERRDRIVWNLTSDRQVMRIALPTGTRINESDMRAVIHGRRVEGLQMDADRELVIRLDPQDIGKPLVLELWYTQPRGPRDGKLVLRVPELVQAQSPPLTYWQVIVPFAEHYWSVGPNWSAEVRWRRWGKIWWRRQWPAQSDFEKWAGATVQPPLPDGVHAYSFSAFGSPTFLEMQTIRRSWLVLAVSGLVLGLGWFFLTFQWYRRPLFLVVLGTLVLACALWSPLIAATVAEAATIGIACLLIAGWLHWFIERPRAARPTSVHASPSGQTPAARRDSGMTTLTAPAVAHGSSVDAIR